MADPVAHCLDWADTTLSLDDIFVDFSTPSRESPSGVPSPGRIGPAPRPKLLACTRCHAQKLRCVRQRQHSRVCNRCLSAGTECVRRQPQRMGRPADASPRARRRRATEVQALTPQSPPSAGLQLSTIGHEDRTMIRAPTPDSTIPPSRGGVAPLFNSRDSTCLMEQWNWQNLEKVPSGVDMRSRDTGERQDVTAASSAAQLTTDSSGSSLSPTPPRSYGGPLVAGIGGLNSLLVDFDDIPPHLFSPESGIDVYKAPRQSPASAPTAETIPPPDPVEQLTRLHLDLYQCLNSVRVVETYKKRTPQETAESSSSSLNEVDTSWIESIFEATERFITTLQSHASWINSRRDSEPSPKARSGDEEASSVEDGHHPQTHTPPAELDAATGLMIVSCYTRLLQTLEVVVALVLVQKNTDCPGDVVQVRFGAFFPAADKTLHVRLVLQYILHLLEGASRAVDRAVTSKPLYARALADVHTTKAKLKEGVEAGLH